MAWIYFQESEELASDLANGLKQSPIVKTTHSPNPFCLTAWRNGKFVELQSGMTCERCTAKCCQESTSFSEGSPVRTSALQELERAWAEVDQDFFLKSRDWLAKFDQHSFSWKTSQLSLFGDLTEFSWSSLRWGIVADGQLYQPQNLAPRTFAKDGFYLPTPTATEGGFNQSASDNAKIRPSLSMMARKNIWPTPRASEATRGHGGGKNRKENQLTLSQKIGGKLNPQFVEWLMGFSIDHTALNALGMQWFQSKQKKRSKG